MIELKFDGLADVNAARPLYETAQDRKREVEAAIALEAAWGGMFHKQEPLAPIDFAWTFRGKMIALVEFKYRSRDYIEDDTFLFMAKVRKALAMARRLGVPLFYVVQLQSHNLYWYQVTGFEARARGGRTLFPRDDQDIQEAIRIPAKQFNPISMCPIPLGDRDYPKVWTHGDE